jgi:hypothetical protein
LRKKLFRHLAIGSGRRRINFDFIFCHRIPPRSLIDSHVLSYFYTYRLSIVNQCFF